MKRSRIPSFLKMSVGIFLISLTPVLSGQPKKPANMPQYLFSDFSNSLVVMKSIKSQNVMINYNMVTERMVFTQDASYYNLSNPEMVDTIYLNQKIFVPFGNTFFEMLQSRPIALFIQHKGELEEAGVPSGYGGTSKTTASVNLANIDRSKASFNLPIPDNYSIRIANVFWIRLGDKMLDFTNEKQFLQLFPDKSKQLKEYIKKNHLKIDNPDHLKQLVNYCGTLN